MIFITAVDVVKILVVPVAGSAVDYIKGVVAKCFLGSECHGLVKTWQNQRLRHRCQGVRSRRLCRCGVRGAVQGWRVGGCPVVGLERT